MRILPSWIAICLGTLCLYIEYRSVKSDILFDFLIANIPFITLCILFLVFLGKDIKFYTITRKTHAFLPTAICLAFVTAIGFHMYANSDDENNIVFSATNYEMTEPHDVQLIFKKDGTLKMIGDAYMGKTYYLGQYTILNDTISIALENDLNLGTKAVRKGDTIQFIGEKTYFLVDR